MVLAGETRSHARMASEGLRDTGTSRPGGLSYGNIARIETAMARQRIYETLSFNYRTLALEDEADYPSFGSESLTHPDKS